MLPMQRRLSISPPALHLRGGGRKKRIVFVRDEGTRHGPEHVTCGESGIRVLGKPTAVNRALVENVQERLPRRPSMKLSMLSRDSPLLLPGAVRGGALSIRLPRLITEEELEDVLGPAVGGGAGGLSRRGG